MPNFRNRAPRPRYKRGLILGLSGTGLAYVVIQLLHIFYGVKKIREVNTESISGDNKDSHAWIVVTDSTGKKDTILLTDYIEKNKQPADTSKTKTEVIFPK